MQHFSGSRPEGASLPALPDPRLANAATAENVDALLNTIRSLLDAEESRDQSFNTRGVGLAGFVGIIVSLSTTLGRDALQTDLVGDWKIASVALFAGAVVLLLASVITVVAGVLRPKETAHLAYSEAERYPLPERIYEHKVMTQGRELRGLVEVLGVERQRATRKARSLRWGYWLLIGGLCCIGSLSFILGLHDAGVIRDDGSRSAGYTLCLEHRSTSSTTTTRAAAVRFAIRQACP